MEAISTLCNIKKRAASSGARPSLPPFTWRKPQRRQRISGKCVKSHAPTSQPAVRHFAHKRELYHQTSGGGLESKQVTLGLVFIVRHSVQQCKVNIAPSHPPGVFSTLQTTCRLSRNDIAIETNSHKRCKTKRPKHVSCFGPKLFMPVTHVPVAQQLYCLCDACRSQSTRKKKTLASTLEVSADIINHATVGVN